MTEDGQDSFHVVVHLDRRRLAEGKVALAGIACAGPCDQRIGQRLSFDLLVVGPPINVDDVACAMFHGLHLCSGDQPILVSGGRMAAAQRASR